MFWNRWQGTCPWLSISRFDPAKAGAWNFGPDNRSAATVSDVLQIAQRKFGSGAVDLSRRETGLHEAGYLMLNSAKARQHLQFEPMWDLESTLDKTMDWYRRLYAGEPAGLLCVQDIEAYAGSTVSRVKTAI